MVVDGVTWCHADESDEEEDDGESVECFGGEVEAEHNKYCPKTEESKELNVVLEG